jgi:2-aminoadipate transaminase
MFRQALDQGVLYVPGRLCYAEDPPRRAPDREMRISFGSATLREIAVGVARLGRVIGEFI